MRSVSELQQFDLTRTHNIMIIHLLDHFSVLHESRWAGSPNRYCISFTKPFDVFFLYNVRIDVFSYVIDSICHVVIFLADFTEVDILLIAGYEALVLLLMILYLP